MLRLALCLATVLIAAGAHPAMAETEQARYTIVEADGAFELRDYAPMIVAEVEVAGTRDQAVNAGFRILAGYIFGGNEPEQKIAMTVPVTQQRMGEGPVTGEVRGKDWAVRFMMPSGSSLATLPKPDDGRIRFVEVPGERVAALRFSGFRTDAALDARVDELAAILKARGLTPVGAPVFAYYDPPWTLPFLRRNEVLWRVKR